MNSGFKEAVIAPKLVAISSIVDIPVFAIAPDFVSITKIVLL
jgi:hypothetical protein